MLWVLALELADRVDADICHILSDIFAHAGNLFENF